MGSCSVQVHVLLMSVGLEPNLARTMTSAAALLSPHSLCLTSSMPLVPRASELKQQNAQVGWRLEESALGNAASGARFLRKLPQLPVTLKPLTELMRALHKTEKMHCQWDD